MSEPKYRDAEWLREQYVEKGKSSEQIGDDCGVYGSTILTHLRKNGIEPKYHSRSQFKSIDVDVDGIERLYWDKGMTLEEVGEDIGVSTTTVRRRMDEHDIPIEYPSGDDNPRSVEYEALVCDNCGNEYEKRPSVAENSRFCSKECLYDGRDYTGNRNPNWRGGLFGYGEDWENKRVKALKRDDRECQGCGVSESEMERSLDVHHIVPRRMFHESDELDMDAMNEPDNLVSLCRACHEQAEPSVEVVI